MDRRRATPKAEEDEDAMEQLAERLSRLSERQPAESLAGLGEGDGTSSIDFDAPRVRAVPMPPASAPAQLPNEFFEPGEVPLELGNRAALPPGWAHPHAQGSQRARRKKKRDAEAEALRPAPVPRSRSAEELLATGAPDFALVSRAPVRTSTPGLDEAEEAEDTAAAREHRRRGEAGLGARTTIYHADRVIVPRYPTMPYGLLVGVDFEKAKTLKDQLFRDFGIARVRFDEDRGIEFFCTGRAKQEHAAKVVEDFVRRRSTLVFDLDETVARDTFDYVGRRKDVQAAGIYLDIKPLVGDKRSRSRIVVKGAWWDLDKAQALVRHERQDIASIVNKAAEDFTERRRKGPRSRTFLQPVEEAEAEAPSSAKADDGGAVWDGGAVDADEAKAAGEVPRKGGGGPGFDGSQKTGLLAGRPGGGDIADLPASDLLAMEALDVSFEGLSYGGDVSRSAFSLSDPTMAEATAHAIAATGMGFGSDFHVERRMPQDFEPGTLKSELLQDAPQVVTKVMVDKTTVVGRDARAVKEAVTIATEEAKTEPEEAEPLPGFMLVARAFRRAHPSYNEHDLDGAAVDAADDYDSDASAASRTDFEDTTTTLPRDADQSAQLLRRLTLDLDKRDALPTRLASEFLLWQIWLQAKAACDRHRTFPELVREKLNERGETFLESLMMLDDESQALNQDLVDCLCRGTTLFPAHCDIGAGGPKPARTRAATRKRPDDAGGHLKPRKEGASKTRSGGKTAGKKAGQLSFRKLVRNAIAARARDAGIDDKELLAHLESTVAGLTEQLTETFGSLEDLVSTVHDEKGYHVEVCKTDEEWHHWLFDIGTFLRTELIKVQPFAETVKLARSMLFQATSETAAEADRLLRELKAFVEERVEEPHGFDKKTPQAFLRDQLRDALQPFVPDETLVESLVTEDSAFRLVLPDGCGEEARGNARICIEASDSKEQLPNFFYALIRFRKGLEVEANGVVNSLRLGVAPGGKHGSRAVPLAMQDVDFFHAALALRLSLVHREVDAIENRTWGRVRRSTRRKRPRRPRGGSSEEDAADLPSEEDTDSDGSLEKEPLQAGAGDAVESGASAPMDTIFTEFSFRYMRVRTPVAPDGDCGFRSLGVQLRRSAEDMRQVAAGYIESQPFALQGFFSANVADGEPSARRAQLLQDARNGLFSDGHAKAVAESLGVRIFIVEGRAFPQRVVRVYTSDPNQSQETMKRHINDPNLGISDADVVLVCDRDDSGTEHCDPVVPAGLYAVLETLNVVDVAYKKWEIRSGGFKCTGFYKKFNYADACLAHLLLYRQRRGEAEKATFAKIFGFAWSEDVSSRITAELHKMPGVEAFTCDCIRERCEERAQLKPLHRALIMKHYVDAFRSVKAKQRAAMTEAEEVRWKEAGKQIYADFRTQIAFLFDTVKRGGVKKQAASLASRGRAMDLPPDWQNADRLVRNHWLRLSAYMEITRREEAQEAAMAAGGGSELGSLGSRSPATSPVISGDLDLAAAVGGKRTLEKLEEVSPELSPEPMGSGGMRFGTAGPGSMMPGTMGPGTASFPLGGVAAIPVGPVPPAPPAPLMGTPSETSATSSPFPASMERGESMDLAVGALSVPPDGPGADVDAMSTVAPEPWDTPGANDFLGEAISELEGPDFLDWVSVAELFAPSDDMDIGGDSDFGMHEDPTMLSSMNLPTLGRATSLTPSLTEELQFHDGSTFTFLSE